MPVEHAIARIYQPSGTVVGTGFLVDEAHVMTCAHVVNSALGRPRNAETQPSDPITLDFPLLPEGRRDRISARVAAWG